MKIRVPFDACKRKRLHIGALAVLWLAAAVPDVRAESESLTNAYRRQLGPSSKLTPLIVSEIMYHPAARADGRNLEFVELFNTESVSQDLGGYRLAGDIGYTFATGTVLAARSYLVVAAAPADLQNVHGVTALGPYTNALPNSGGTVRLRNRQGAVLVDAEYGTDAPWPVSADGAGHALTLWRPDYGEADARAWGAGSRVGGSPRAPDAPDADPLSRVRINEFLAHTDLPQVDFVELHNTGTQAVSLAGCTLSDTIATNKFVFPPGSMIAARGFVSLTQTNLGFSLSSHGDDLYLRDATGTRVLDVVRFGAQQNGVATGRYPDGAPEFHELSATTAGSSNALLFLRDIVINEIMYHPISDADGDEYVELFNRSTGAVNVGHWTFTDGIAFTIPAGTVIPAGGFLVIAADAANLLAKYPQLNAANVVGDFVGDLSDRGERLALAKPDDPALPFEDFVTVDEVTYNDGWGAWCDGGGSSLELIDAHSDNRRAQNWAGSDETAKAPWSTIKHTGPLELGMSTFAPGELHLMLLDQGECLVDDIEVIKNGGTNLLTNGGFESGLAGWVLKGNQGASMVVTNGAFSGARCLQLSADAGGDNGSNCIETDLGGLVSVDTNVTIRARVRWLAGHRQVLLRLLGNWLECSGAAAVPANLGTPGLVNSRQRANAGPALWALAHAPLLPAAGSNVTVFVHAHDPDGLAGLSLRYRLDPGTNLLSVALTNAGAGQYSGVIPGQAANAMVAFRVEAVDGAGVTNALPAPDAPEALICFGQPTPAGDLGAYRIWITQDTRARWAAETNFSNRLLPMTLVYNQARAIYDAQVRYHSSVFLRLSGDPYSVSNSYTFKLPQDDRLFGRTGFTVDGLEFGRDPSYQREWYCYRMADQLGLPFNAQRYTHVYLNHQKKGQVFADKEYPNRGFLSAWYPDDDAGALREIDDWFEFFDILRDRGYTDNFHFRNARLERYAGADGALKRARYRWNWERKTNAATDDAVDDLFALVEAMNLPLGATFEARIAALVDVEQWMRIFAVRHAVNDDDGYSYNRGKNMYTYRPVQGGWKMFLWDLDTSLGTYGRSPTDPLFDIEDPVLSSRFFTQPRFKRAYWRALQDIADGPMLAATANPILEAQHAAHVTNGVPAAHPSDIESWIASRRAYLQSQLSSVAAAFDVTTVSHSTSASTGLVAGTAPVAVARILINSNAYPVTWTSETAWQVRVGLKPGANLFQAVGLAGNGQAIGGDSVTITATGPAVPSPAGWVVINEIMYNAPFAKGNYVELYNRSPTQLFDLAGCRLDGVDFDFPGGSFLAPGGFLVVAESAASYAWHYTNAEVVVGEYAGALDRGGETLCLLAPAGGTNWSVIDAVTYDDDPPWPGAADGGGQALQLMDAAQDNDRPGNWIFREVTPLDNWQFRSASGVVGPGHPSILSQSKLRLWLDGAGQAYVDGITLVTGGVAGAGASLATNGGFESGLAPWAASGNHAASGVSTNVAQSGIAGLRLAASGAGDASNVVQQTVALNGRTGQTLTLGLWYLESTNPVSLHAELSNSSLAFDQALAAPATVFEPYTPGRTNALAASVPALVRLWINEVMPSNTAGVVDNAGEREPWIELYNAETATVALAEFRLSNDYGVLDRWAFPTGMTVGAGQRVLVWADGQPEQDGAGQAHTSFRLDGTAGSVALSRVSGGRVYLIDALDYAGVPPNASCGSHPEGDPHARQVFYLPTPGAVNSPSSGVLRVRINEWMARNNATIRDPSDGDFEDWFELYNTGSSTAELAGYRLADDPLDASPFVIPLGFALPPGGHALVWADGDVDANAGGGALHVDFNLSTGGDAIVLTAPDGTVVDAVSFGPQAADVAQGLWPDGISPAREMMPATPGTTNRVLAVGAIMPADPAGVSVSGGSQSGRIYRLEMSTNLLATNWVGVGVVTAQGAQVTATDTNTGLPAPRFYRLQRMP